MTTDLRSTFGNQRTRFGFPSINTGTGTAGFNLNWDIDSDFAGADVKLTALVLNRNRSYAETSVQLTATDLQLQIVGRWGTNITMTFDMRAATSQTSGVWQNDLSLITGESSRSVADFITLMSTRSGRVNFILTGVSAATAPSLRIGDVDPPNIYLGDDRVIRAYKGTELVWGAEE